MIESRIQAPVNDAQGPQRLRLDPSTSQGLVTLPEPSLPSTRDRITRRKRGKPDILGPYGELSPELRALVISFVGDHRRQAELVLAELRDPAQGRARKQAGLSPQPGALCRHLQGHAPLLRRLPPATLRYLLTSSTLGNIVAHAALRPRLESNAGIADVIQLLNVASRRRVLALSSQHLLTCFTTAPEVAQQQMWQGVYGLFAPLLSRAVGERIPVASSREYHLLEVLRELLNQSPAGALRDARYVDLDGLRHALLGPAWPAEVRRTLVELQAQFGTESSAELQILFSAQKTGLVEGGLLSAEAAAITKDVLAGISHAGMRGAILRNLAVHAPPNSGLNGSASLVERERLHRLVIAAIADSGFPIQQRSMLSAHVYEQRLSQRLPYRESGRLVNTVIQFVGEREINPHERITLFAYALGHGLQELPLDRSPALLHNATSLLASPKLMRSWRDEIVATLLESYAQRKFEKPVDAGLLHILRSELMDRRLSTKSRMRFLNTLNSAVHSGHSAGIADLLLQFGSDPANFESHQRVRDAFAFALKKSLLALDQRDPHRHGEVFKTLLMRLDGGRLSPNTRDRIFEALLPAPHRQSPLPLDHAANVALLQAVRRSLARFPAHSLKHRAFVCANVLHVFSELSGERTLKNQLLHHVLENLGRLHEHPAYAEIITCSLTRLLFRERALNETDRQLIVQSLGPALTGQTYEAKTIHHGLRLASHFVEVLRPGSQLGVISQTKIIMDIRTFFDSSADLLTASGLSGENRRLYKRVQAMVEAAADRLV